MSFNHYYQSELTALRRLGKRFAERNPALAPFLGQSGRDPDVERLLEGFAFLTGRLRQKLDDELPELTHSLMHLLWPNYMRPLPAFSMLQFDELKRPGPGLLVERGTPVQARPVQGVACRFQTCFPTEVLPLTLRGLDYSVKGDGALLSMRLAMSVDGHLGEIGLTKLRLHLAGEPYISQMLYLSLLRNLAGIELVLLDGEGKPLTADHGQLVATLQLKSDCSRTLACAENNVQIPYTLNPIGGYHSLQECFGLQGRFLFIDIVKVDVKRQVSVDVHLQAAGLELRFDVKKAGGQHIRP